MRKQAALFFISLGTFSIGVIAESLTPIATAWFWGFIAGLCLFAATVLYMPELREWLVFQFLILTRRVPWDEPPVRRFRLLYPHIRELANSSLPYDNAKFGALQKRLNILGIRLPVNPTRMPKYLSLLARFSKQGRLKDAREMHNHYDFRANKSDTP